MRNRLTRMKKADPFTLGREKDPAGDYGKGSPSEWGEDVYEHNLSKLDSREETGHGAESKKDFGPSVKEAAIRQAKQIKAKAVKCVRIAEAMLPNSSEEEIEDQGLDLMELSDRAVEATLRRLAELEAEQEVEAAEEDEQEVEAAEEAEVAKQARYLLAKVRGMIAELEEDEVEEDEVDEDEVDEDEVDEDEAEEEEVLSESEKQASVLVKKAKGIILAAEAEEELGELEEAEELKKEARKVLASARRVLAGLEDLHPALQENAKKMQEEAEEEEVSLEDKKAAAFKHLEAARRLMAEWESECGKEELEEEEAAEEELEEEAAEEELEEAAEDDMEAEADLEEAAEEELDMIPSDKDQALEEIFMNEDMKDAQEAYEMAFNGEGKEEAPVKTASKKGAKSLKSGIKISSVSNSDLSNLWDAPPDVSHLFK